MTEPTFADPLAWRTVKAPTLEAFEVLAETAFRRLPKKFRALCDGLVIRVEDFPAEDVLTELEAQSEFDLLGLFQGVGLPFRSESVSGQMPNMIWLYRRPILDYWAEHDEALGPSSLTCWCTRSATISVSPTRTWRRSRRRGVDGVGVRAHATPGAATIGRQRSAALRLAERRPVVPLSSVADPRG